MESPNTHALDDYDHLCRTLHGHARLGESRDETVARRLATGLSADNGPVMSAHTQRINAWAKDQAEAMRRGDAITHPPEPGDES